MIADEIKESFICSLSKDKHLLEAPINLPCGHSVCKKCLPKHTSPKCKSCGDVANIDLSAFKESYFINLAIKSSLDHLFTIIKTKTVEQISMIKHHSDTWKNSIDLKFQFIKEEIDIRIESLKNELDEVQQNLEKDLILLKEDVIRLEEEKIFQANNLIKNHENSLNKLNENLMKDGKVNEEMFYAHQSISKDLNKIIEDLEFKNFHVDLKVSTEKIGKEILGEINFKNHSFFKVPNAIKQGITDCIKISQPCVDMFAINDDKIISINFYDKSLSIYNHNFEEIKTVHQIEGQKFQSFNVASNDNDRIYISDNNNHQIIMLDFDFNLIKKFGSFGFSADQFSTPWGISFKNDYLYVCDVYNKRIQVLTKELEFHKTLNLDFEVWLIKVTDKIICLQLQNPTGIHFYDLKSFNLLNKYNHGWCRISEINSCFYEFEYTTSNLNCYNENGDLIRSFETNLYFPNSLSPHWSGYIFQLKENLYMTVNSSKNLMKFSISK